MPRERIVSAGNQTVEEAQVNYALRPQSFAQYVGQESLIRKLKIKPRDLLRKSEPVYKELGLSNDEFSDGELIDLMIKHPDLLQRPIVERGNRAVLGRPVENVKELL